MNLGIKIFCIVEILANISFYYGYFKHIEWLIIISGCYLLLITLSGISYRALNPLFPTILGIILAFTIHPWYHGIFWAVAIFDLLNIPSLIKRIIF